MNPIMQKLNQVLTAWNEKVAAAFKELKTFVGLKGNLKTTNKDSLVNAINEVHDVAKAAANSGGAAINDASASGLTVYSSEKVAAEIEAAKTAVVNTLLGQSDLEEAYRTLQKVSEYIKSDKALGAQMATDIANRLRFDSDQALSDEQINQVLKNLKFGEPVDLAALWDSEMAK